MCVFFADVNVNFHRKKEQNERTIFIDVPLFIKNKYAHSVGNISNREATVNIYVNDQALRVCNLIDVLKHIERCMSLTNTHTRSVNINNFYNSIMPSISHPDQKSSFHS